MPNYIPRWFLPPDFKNDEKNRTARWLYVISLSILGATFVATVAEIAIYNYANAQKAGLLWVISITPTLCN